MLYENDYNQWILNNSEEQFYQKTQTTETVAEIGIKLQTTARMCFPHFSRQGVGQIAKDEVFPLTSN